MDPRPFDDRTHLPAEPELGEVLGPVRGAWEDIKRSVSTLFPPVTERWVYGGKRYGWSLRLEHKKRGVLYLTPDRGFFRVGLAFGETAIRETLQSDLPAPVLEIVAGAPEAPEGRAVRMLVTSDEDARIAVRLAAFKMES